MAAARGVLVVAPAAVIGATAVMAVAASVAAVIPAAAVDSIRRSIAGADSYFVRESVGVFTSL